MIFHVVSYLTHLRHSPTLCAQHPFMARERRSAIELWRSLQLRNLGAALDASPASWPDVAAEWSLEDFERRGDVRVVQAARAERARRRDLET